MGQNFSSEPVVEKETERDHNDTFNVAVSSCQGWRMSQEDNHTMLLEIPGSEKGAFFAVYDGHGSAKVSKHASEGLWRHLVENECFLKGNYKEALEGAFLTFDQEVNKSYNAQLAGTTAVCLLVVDNIIYCANIGDSRAVACVNCECVPLSHDHKPENPLELKRILAAGGYVLGNRVNGNLALSRAFGDFHYKNNDQLPPSQQIVSPCPDVKMIELNDDVDFLVLACDGIWDVLSSEEVVDFVISRLEQSMEPGLICEQLTTRCLATDYELVIGCDNMTVLLICYTRGRNWADFCTDIFNKNTRKLGVNRTRPTRDECTTIEELESSTRRNFDNAEPDDEYIMRIQDSIMNSMNSYTAPSNEEESSEGGGVSSEVVEISEESKQNDEEPLKNTEEPVTITSEEPQLPAEPCTVSDTPPAPPPPGSCVDQDDSENETDDDKRAVCIIKGSEQPNDSTESQLSENDSNTCEAPKPEMCLVEDVKQEPKEEDTSGDNCNLDTVSKSEDNKDADVAQGSDEKDCEIDGEQEDSTNEVAVES